VAIQHVLNKENKSADVSK